MRKIWFLLFAIFLSAAGAVHADTFPDVQKHWAKSNIQWALAKNIVIGYPDGTFKPDRAVTEAEFLAILLRTYHNTNKQINERTANSTSPSPVGDWTDPYYEVASWYNIPVHGDTHPDRRGKPITRGLVAQMIAGAYGKHYNVEGAIAYLYDHDLSKGKKDKTIEGYLPNDFLTRAEAVTFIKTIVTKELNGSMLKRPEKEEPNPSVGKYKK